ncbi:S-adenosyl-L-methionine-dependent methyltransferase [Teratosphaeria nubilosa]|uniref:S-adenosyl-L-methionine-dependent methyltransferase n=1 Tax=Teratosphaeria nubilosa TaxID=161662 RepID=A0A6G1LKL5_9PEZI|nr:S-adenosyl-L-methionine-dependent methyltransferase [Teratosphaeria nubilosa]
MSQEQTDDHPGGRSFQDLMASMAQSLTCMQSPSDFVILLMYSTSIHTPIRILLEAGILHQLARNPEPLSVTQLAADIQNVGKTTTVDEAAAREEFITRMLRPAAILHLIDQVDGMLWQGNELTRTLTEPGLDAGLKLMYDSIMGPASVNSKLVAWAKEHNYCAPTDPVGGPYQQAHDIAGTSALDHWIKSNNGLASTHLSALMKRIQRARLHWTTWFSETNLFRSLPQNPDDPFLIDVGGALGHDLQALATAHPTRDLRFILQDLPPVISAARKESLDPRIHLMAHDFFSPQPLRNAKIYYLHKVMHDWPDAQAIRILAHLRDAMGEDSRIFINDLILPDVGAPPFMAESDISMLALFSAKERSEAMWRRLVEAVGGLVVVGVWQAPGLMGEGIVEVMRRA